MSNELRLHALQLAHGTEPAEIIVKRANAYYNFLVGVEGNAPAATPTKPEKPKADPALIATPNPAADAVADQATGAGMSEKPAETGISSADIEAKVPIVAQKVNQVKGRDTLIATLAEFGAKNISGIAADKKAAFVARCEELIG